jgi:predicted RNase H-like HicB family nuclease
MNVLHVQVEASNGWLIAQGLEEPAIITQGRSFDEIIENVREVWELLGNKTAVQIELIVPPSAHTQPRKPRKQSAKPVRV